MSEANAIDWAIRASDAGFSSTMRSVIDTLQGVKRGTDGAKSGLNDLGNVASASTALWVKHRRELESLYTSMGKVPSKEVVAELDKIEAKYKSLAAAAEGGNSAAATAMRNLMSQARATVTKDTVADPVASSSAGAATRATLGEKTIGAATGALRTAAASLAAAFTAAAIATHVRDQIELADALDETAQKAAVSAQSLSTLVYAAKFGGVDTEGLSNALIKLSRTMFEADTGNRKAAATFQVLGVSIRDQEGRLRDGDRVLIDLAERFSTMPDSAQKAALAMEVFGKSGAQLLPFLNLGAEGIEKLRAEARELGIEISDETAAAAGDLNDKLDVMRARVDGVWRQFASHLIPTLSAAADGFGDSAKSGGTLNAVMTGVDYTLKTLIISGGAIVAVFQDVGTVVGGAAAAAMAAASGDFAGARNILGMMTDDLQKNGKAFEDYARKVWTGRSDESDAPRAKKEVDLAPIRESGSGSPRSRVAQWDNELDRMKAAHQRMTAEQGTFEEFSRERERDYWKQRLAEQSMSTDERFAVEKKYLSAVQAINNEAFSASIALQRNQMAEMGKNHVAQVEFAEQIAERMRQAYGAESRQYADAQRALLNVRRQADDQRRQMADLALTDQRGAAAQSIELDRQQAQLSLDLGLINRRQFLTMEIDHQNQLNEIRRAALERKRETTDPDRDPVAYQQTLNQLLEQERSFEVAKRKLTADLEVETSAPGASVFSTLEGSFSGAVDGMLNRAQTWQSAMGGIVTSVGNAFIQELAVKPLAAWIASMAKRLLLTQTTTAAETTLETVASGVKMGASAAASTVQVANNAVVAGTGAAASQAPIPLVGPGLAAAAMAAMLVAVLAMGSSIKSARGGYDIPAGINPMTQLHEEEMVLPARYANMIRGMSERPTGEEGGGIHFAPVVHALDARGVDRVLEKHGQKWIDYLLQHKRKF